MIIYSDDPRGIKAAIAEELAKNPNAQIQLKRVKKQRVVSKSIEARTDVLDEQAIEISKMTKRQLQDALVAQGIAFETDANKDRLIELLEGLK